MNSGRIRTLVAKDFSIFFRNRFFAIITVLGLVFYTVIYFVMPPAVDENLRIGVYVPGMPSIGEVQEAGLEVEMAASEAALREAVTEGDYVAGIVIPPEVVTGPLPEEKPVITVYFAPDVPEEIKDAVKVIIRTLAYEMTGQAQPVAIAEEVIGTDMMGMQVPPRDRMRPLLAIFLIIAETMGLANLISSEVEQRTIQALLVTPVSVKELFTAKGVTGVLLAFGQAALFMAIVGGFSRQPLIILVTLLLGAVLATAVGFLIASLGKDMMSVMAWGVLAFVALSVPAFSIMFPGASTGWVEIIPSYYLVSTIHEVSNFGAAWGDVWGNLLILTGVDIVLAWVGIMALRRKTQ
jgi:ABC-2 type transport system permease protein